MITTELHNRAVAVVRQVPRVSVSFLQRALGIGYFRAEEVIERLVECGIIRPCKPGLYDVVLKTSD